MLFVYVLAMLVTSLGVLSCSGQDNAPQMKVAFISESDGNWDIYRMNADGSGQTRLTDNRMIDVEPSGSPDGEKIAFASNRDDNFEIYTMSADGSGVTNLTQNPYDDNQPTWSPDGKKIAFASSRSGKFDIYVMNADGSGVTNLTGNPENGDFLGWSWLFVLHLLQNIGGVIWALSGRGKCMSISTHFRSEPRKMARLQDALQSV